MVAYDLLSLYDTAIMFQSVGDLHAGLADTLAVPFFFEKGRKNWVKRPR